MNSAPSDAGAPTRLTDVRQTASAAWLWGLGGMLLVCMLLSLLLGRYVLPPAALWQLCVPHHADPLPLASTIIHTIRLPRILSAVLIGAALSLSGAAYQGLFRNPMASPDLLGVTAGAGLGAAGAIAYGASGWVIQLVAFLGGIAAVACTYLLSMRLRRDGDARLMLLLIGMVVATLGMSGISAIKYLADPTNTLPAITFWLMGSLAAATREDTCLLMGALLVGLAVLLGLRWQLNAMACGEDEAQTLGVHTGRVRVLTILAGTLLTATAVSIGGIIGWMGLVIPHCSRALVGPNYARLLPGAALLGAIFLLLVDNVARCLLPVEIPLGILTAAIGGPFFLSLLSRRDSGWTP